MFDFSGDESLALIVSGIAAVTAAVRFYGGLFFVSTLGGGRKVRLALAATPPLCLLILLPFLLHLSAREVKADRGYVVLFLLAGAAWLGLGGIISAMLGVSLRDDAIERRNSAAAIALCGAMLGITAIFTGANVGEGATIWMTFGPAALATTGWAVAWFLLELVTKISDAIAIERDTLAATLLALFLLASGILLGWALAGDYESFDKTCRDFAVRGWPVIPLAVITVIAHTLLRRRRTRS